MDKLLQIIHEGNHPNKLTYCIYKIKLFYDYRLLLLIDPVIIHISIKNPLAPKRSITLFFKFPNKKKLGASDATKSRYPPKATSTIAENKIIFLKNPITINQLMAFKNY